MWQSMLNSLISKETNEDVNLLRRVKSLEHGKERKRATGADRSKAATDPGAPGDMFRKVTQRKVNQMKTKLPLKSSESQDLF